MNYLYHCQPQAEEFARQIIPVPADYPLRFGLPGDFRARFAKLCDLANEMYFDMAKRPEAYGLKLIDISSQDRNAIQAAKNTIHRLVDTLTRLCQSGRLENHRLVVDAGLFRAAIKKAQGGVSNPVPRYELILARLVDFGFVISDFTGKPFAKTVESFTMEYPDAPEMADTLKIYCDCWADLKNNHEDVLVWKWFGVYGFDYKVTANHKKLTAQQWLHDKAQRFRYTEETDRFYIAFHEYSLNYKGLYFNGDYNYKNKRIGRDLQYGLGKNSLSLILKDMDKYMAELETMPESIKDQFRKSSCNHCAMHYGAAEDICNYRRHWTMEGQAHDACAFHGFQFTDFAIERVPYYWRLLELEYGLKKE